MKIPITYEVDKDGGCWATTTIGEHYYSSKEETFEKAKEKLIERIKTAIEKMPTVIPASEEVEV